MEIKKVITNIISDVIEVEIDIENLDNDTDFINKFDLSSLNFIKLIVEIENNFKVTVPDELLIMDGFNSINKIETFLYSQLKNK